MTPAEQLEALKVFCENATKNLALPVRMKKGKPQKNRPPKVYRMRLPSLDDEEEQIPYLVLQLLTVSDRQLSGQERDGCSRIRIVGAVYGDNGEDGALAALNLFTCVRNALLQTTVIGGFYELDLEEKMEFVIYPDSTPPYYLGEMMTYWKIPTIERTI